MNLLIKKPQRWDYDSGETKRLRSVVDRECIPLRLKLDIIHIPYIYATEDVVFKVKPDFLTKREELPTNKEAAKGNATFISSLSK